jgi:addiction module RelB/DinJ family antitoxin
MATGRIQARVDANLLKMAEKLLMDQGIKLTQAITMFLTQVKELGGFPYPLACGCQSNARKCTHSHKFRDDVAEDLRKALTGKGVKSYKNNKEMFESLGI